MQRKQTISAIFLAFVVLSSACTSTQQSCNGQCYSPTSNTCATDYDGSLLLCGYGLQACKGACYSPANYHCNNGVLLSGPASTSPVVRASTSSSTATPTTSSSTTKASTSSSTSAPSTSSSAAAVASTSAAAVVSSCASGCPSGLCNCNGACYTPGQYNCPVDAFTSKIMLCSGALAACNGVCYDSTKQSCSSAGKLVNGVSANSGAAAVAASTSQSTSAAAAATSAAPVNVNPSPVASNRPKQTADLRIVNSCKSTLWFEARYGGAGAPIPGQSVTAIQALPGGYVDYTVPATGLSGSRFWAKYGCDVNGKNCAIGDQMQYWPNPPGGCPANGCTPPVDSLFEATWGCKPGASCNTQNPTTWFDTSQVDGWTIPYKLTPNGDTSGCDCNGPNCGFNGVDASTLNLANCPTGEDLTANGQYSSVDVWSQGNVSLSSVDLRIISNKQVIGCMSPCKRLNWGIPYGLQQGEGSGSTMWMCCPTPTPADCSPSNGCISPTACRNGPIEGTKYVKAVHDMAPGVYSYSYDDGVGLHACPAGVVTYTMEFCPAGSSQYPLQL